MTKILKNTTASPITIRDLGITIPALSSYTTTPGEWDTAATSSELPTLIDAGSIIVNDGYEDLTALNGKRHVQEESLSRDTAMDMILIEYTTVLNDVKYMAADGPTIFVFDGSAMNQAVWLPDATKLNNGACRIIQNESTEPIYVYNAAGMLDIALNPEYRVTYYLRDNSTIGGDWMRAPESTAALSGTAPILGFYGGNAGVGRYLEIFPGTDSLTVPFLIVVNQRLVALSLSAAAASTGTVGLFRTTDLVNPAATISLSNQLTNADITLSVPLAQNARICARVTSGSINKPALAIYLST